MRMLHWKLDIDQKLLKLFLLLIPVFILSAIFIADVHGKTTSDFFSLWLAGKMNWTNESPYSAEQWAAGHNQFGKSFVPDDIFPFPLPLAILLAPLGLFTFNQAYFIWVVLSEGAIALSICLLVNTYLPDSKKLLFALPLIAATIIFRPAIATVFSGQIGAFFPIIMSLAIIFWEKKKFWQGAVTLSFLLLKPTIGFPVIFFAVVWLLFKKNYKTIFVIGGSGLGWLIIGLLRDPQWVAKFLANGSEKFLGNLGLFPTFWGISDRICSQQTLCTFGIGFGISLILLLATVYIMWSRKSFSFFAIFSLITPVSLLVTPYIWPYDHLILIIPIIYAAITLYKHGYPYLLDSIIPIVFSIISLGFLLLAFELGQDMWSFVVPLICYALVLVLPGTLKESPERISLSP